MTYNFPHAWRTARINSTPFQFALEMLTFHHTQLRLIRSVPFLYHFALDQNHCSGRLGFFLLQLLLLHVLLFSPFALNKVWVKVMKIVTLLDYMEIPPTTTYAFLPPPPPFLPPPPPKIIIMPNGEYWGHSALSLLSREVKTSPLKLVEF